MPPPPDGQWARPGTVDGPIGRFLLPIGGGSAEATWTLHFHITYMAVRPATTKFEKVRCAKPSTQHLLFHITPQRADLSFELAYPQQILKYGTILKKGCGYASPS